MARDDKPRKVRGPSVRLLPADFHLFATIEGDIKLKARYGVGRPVILRWRLQTGLYCGQPRGPRVKRAVSRAVIQRQKPYKRPTMPERISWYDGDDDVSSLIDFRYSRDEELF